jgi:hypothetical protein
MSTQAPTPSTQNPTPAARSRKGIGGPKTPEGKNKVKLNAMKSGIWAHCGEGKKMVADVMGVDFEVILAQMTAHYQPADPEEEVLVRRIARCSWRLRVLEKMEDYTLRGLRIRRAPGKSLEDISVIERRTDIQFHRAIAALAAKRNREGEKVKNKLNPPPSPRSNHAHPNREFVPSKTPTTSRPTTHDPSRHHPRPMTHDP